jgi:hypothetical protein
MYFQSLYYKKANEAGNLAPLVASGECIFPIVFLQKYVKLKKLP